MGLYENMQSAQLIYYVFLKNVKLPLNQLYCPCMRYQWYTAFYRVLHSLSTLLQDYSSQKKTILLSHYRTCWLQILKEALQVQVAQENCSHLTWLPHLVLWKRRYVKVFCLPWNDMTRFPLLHRHFFYNVYVSFNILIETLVV